MSVVNKQRVAYVSGPYRADTIRGVTENIRAAEAIAIELWKMGYAVICPHTNTQYFDGIFGIEKNKGMHPDSENGQKFINGDLTFISRMIPGFDVLVMVPGYICSSGAMQEKLYAESLGINAINWYGYGIGYLERGAKRDGDI